MGGIIIDMAGYTKLKLVNSILQVAMLIILNYLLIPRWGLVGAAIASVGGEGFVNILRLVEVFFIYKILPYNRSFYKPTLATIGAIGVLVLANHFNNYGTNFFLAGLNMAIMTLAYIGIIFLLGFNQEELDLYQIIKTRIMRKLKPGGAK